MCVIFVFVRFESLSVACFPLSNGWPDLVFWASRLGCLLIPLSRAASNAFTIPETDNKRQQVEGGEKNPQAGRQSTTKG